MMGPAKGHGAPEWLGGCVLSRAQQGGFTSFLSPWLQERVKAEELMEQRVAEQDKPDGDKHQGTDRSGRSSSEPRAPGRAARPAEQRQKPGLDRKQHPKVLRARDEF